MHVGILGAAHGHATRPVGPLNEQGGGGLVSTITFVGGDTGTWRVTSVEAVVGAPLPAVQYLSAVQTDNGPMPVDDWQLSGVVSNLRYTTRDEATELRRTQDPLDRPQARLAALIPIRKDERWWALAQDERRAIFEEESRHTSIGMKYLPEIARRLHHCRDLHGPFDFLTWFEYAPEHEETFNDLVAALRATREWGYVDREIDIRLERAG